MFLRANNLKKSYIKGLRSQAIMKGVNLDLNYGEMVCLMGPSGSGKSSLFQALTGLISLDSGEITYYRDERERSSVDMTFGLIFQQNNLFEDFTIQGNFRIQGMMASLSKVTYKERFELMVKRYGIAQLLDEYPSGLSEMERKWVTLAKMEMISPDYFFAEDPTLYLNALAKSKFLDALKGLSRGAGVFVLTNDSYCASYADRVLYMAEGSIRGELVLDHKQLLIEREAQVYGWLKEKGW